MVCVKILSAEDPLENMGMLTSLVTQNCPFPISGSGPIRVREISGPEPKILDPALVKNWAQTCTRHTVWPRKVNLAS